MLSKTPTAAILVIGDEILQGWTQDTNSSFLCRELSERGIEVRRIVTVPDELSEIVLALSRLREYGYDYIFTSGGIGPTPDDVTRAAVAQALGLQLTHDQSAVQRYEELRGTALNTQQLEMCRLPEGAKALYGETTGAPGFKVANVYVLPGVPRILQEMWARCAGDFSGAQQHTESFLTSRRESEFAALMLEYQTNYPELKFGSYPRLKGVDWEVTIRVRGNSRQLVQEAAAKFMADLGGTPIRPVGAL